MTKYTKIVTAKLYGMEKLRMAFLDLRKNVQATVKVEINAMALELEEKAKEYAPVDMGQLRASIRTRFYEDGMAALVECTASYGIFIEYGTGPLGRVRQQYQAPTPPGYVHSSTRKQPPFDVIYAWVQRKGLTMQGATSVASGQKQLAFLIARHIGKYGSKAHPFMYRAYLDLRSQFKRRIWDAIASGQKKSAKPKRSKK